MEVLPQRKEGRQTKVNQYVFTCFVFLLLWYPFPFVSFFLTRKSTKENKKDDSKNKKKGFGWFRWYMLTCVVADILASIEVVAADWTGGEEITSFNSIPWKEIWVHDFARIADFGDNFVPCHYAPAKISVCVWEGPSVTQGLLWRICMQPLMWKHCQQCLYVCV